ncbi:Putative alpha/beta hydrolase-1, serine aminopeptidase, S33 [Septoria linicola]|uniref:Alpha/beta hydrolase-1, serine aminopeptidase, S33 n=1 Tax=Septoria linicola TaxID=215465 RepID=A0A9Q9EGP1_9PEZI|nr:Putative alpha/beta hydrolase-1, serine aminopeptidase, S33 [Septoria linicola]
MDLRSLVRRANFSSRKDLYIALSAPAITFLAAKLIINLYNISTSDGVPTRPNVLKAPSTKLLTAEEYDQVPYPPDALPGGRNVATPYGNLRVYEWGPESGRKVLFVHGISTPCISLSRVASRLVKKGCRVMLFDLPGRGYSDCPDTSHYHQDINLFSTCILSVLSSSQLAWTTEGFTLAGYSLGGGIAAAFTAYYPDLVESLVLIAPGGLLRPTRLSLSSKILYSGLLPDEVVNYFVGRRLRVTTPKPKAAPSTPPSTLRSRIQDLKKFDWTQVPHSNKRRISVTAAVHAETASWSDDEDDNDGEIDPHAPGQDSTSPIFDDRPNISPATAVAWQVETHPGFIPAFISCIKYAPIHDGHALWEIIGERCAAARAQYERYANRIVGRKHSVADSDSSGSEFSEAGAKGARRGLDEGKVLLLLGKKDVIIMPDETAQDASAALGKENVEIMRLNGGHDLVLSNVDGCVNAMVAFWEGGGHGI